MLFSKITEFSHILQRRIWIHHHKILQKPLRKHILWNAIDFSSTNLNGLILAAILFQWWQILTTSYEAVIIRVYSAPENLIGTVKKHVLWNTRLNSKFWKANFGSHFVSKNFSTSYKVALIGVCTKSVDRLPASKGLIMLSIMFILFIWED